MYVQYCILPPTFVPHIFPPPTGTSPPRQDLLLPPVLQFCKIKNMIFFLFKVSTRGVSLWNFHVYMYYNPNWFISSIFLLSTSSYGGINRSTNSIFTLV
jgi:hypothetical protein